MSQLKTRLSETIKTAMKGGDKDTLTWARSLHAAVRKKEVDDRVDLDDAAVVKIVVSSIKQRQESIAQFRQGAREDLAVKEEAEMKFLQTFLPEQLSEAEVKKLVDAAVVEVKPQSVKDMGALMKILMPQVQGKADGKLVNQLVKAALDAAIAR